MIIYIDTSVFCGDYYLRGTDFVMLNDYLKVTDTMLVVSKVVLDELENKYKEMLSLDIVKVNKAYKDINRMLENNLKINDEFIEENFEVFWSNFHMFLKIHGAFLQDYPEVSHKEVVKRNLARKKPFGSKEKPEYRDFLIWLSLLDVAKKYVNRKICFITNNKADFSKYDLNGKISEENILHIDYIEDLKRNNIDIERIEYYCGLNSFIESKVKPTLEKVASCEKVLENGIKNNNNNLRDKIESKLFELLINSEIDIDELEIPDQCEDPYIVSLDEIEDLYATDILMTSEKNLYFMLEFSVYCSLNAYIYKADYYAMDNDDAENIIVEDSDWNDHYMLVEIPSVLLNSSVEMIYDIETTEIISIG